MHLVHAVARLLLGLLPVLSFLGALVLLDSYKLVRLRWVVHMLVAGGAAAALSLNINQAIAVRAGFEGATLAR